MQTDDKIGQLLETLSECRSRADEITEIRKEEEDLPLYDKAEHKNGVDWRTMVFVTLVQ